MFRRLLPLAFFAALMLVPAHAFAAAPVVAGDLDVQCWPGAEAGSSVVIVSLILPDDAPLPATVRVPVPEGVSYDWVGEITGGDPSQDPTRTYTLEDGTGGQYIEFEVTDSRVAQAEGTGPALSIAGTETSFALRFVQTVPSDIVSFSVRLPAGMEPKSMSPEAIADPDKNDAGESLYTLPPSEMKPGDVQEIAVVYSAGSSAPAESGSAAPIVVILAVGIVVAIVALMYSIRRQNPSRSDDEPFGLD